MKQDKIDEIQYHSVTLYRGLRMVLEDTRTACEASLSQFVVLTSRPAFTQGLGR